ncbi:MAG: hypothetical protein JW900_02495 [Anaerolineae bacterium]|nr:hypothetical protein [Anaerolineae bacterium]
MSEKKALHGLGCPQCGGIISIPEGQIVVQCPYCDLCSLVQGERGLRRYQVARRVDRSQALAQLESFFSRSAVARDVARRAQLEQVLLVHLPFWAVWARVLGWIFGQKRVQQGKNVRYDPREVKVAEMMVWSGAACDVGEFGVEQIPLKGKAVEPFAADALHASGLVFEPTGSVSDAEAAAKVDFETRVRDLAGLDRIGQVFVRLVRQRMGLVYYPLWVVRYLYRERAFQLVVDGASGEILYGKAPGSTLYRAAVLVGGMALGALLIVDGAALAFYLATRMDDDGVAGLIVGGIAAIGFGAALMARAYKKFRYGEQYEYRGFEKRKQRRRQSKEGAVLRAREEEG